MTKPRTGCRPFTILDAIILVATTAVGIWWATNIWHALHPGIEPVNGSSDRAWYRVSEAFLLARPMLVSWTACFPVLRGKQPRRPWRKLVKQPGTRACLAVLPIVGVATVLIALQVLRMARRGSLVQLGIWDLISRNLTDLLGVLAPLAGLAVIAAWVTLAIQHRWRPEPGWIDRMGRALGLLWIVEMVIATALWIRFFL